MAGFYDFALETFPWLNDFIPWFHWLKGLFHSVEGLVTVALLFWVSHKLKRERVKLSSLIGDLGDKVDTASELAKAARDAADTAVTPSSGGAPLQQNAQENWEALRTAWLETRERLELAIQAIKHKAVRGKYSKINRNSYREIIITLREDEEITSKTEAALVNMNQKFLAFRSRPSNVTAADVEQFRAWVREVNGDLPKLPVKAASVPTSAS